MLLILHFGAKLNIEILAGRCYYIDTERKTNDRRQTQNTFYKKAFNYFPPLNLQQKHSKTPVQQCGRFFVQF
jgi:hypothetical protein